MLMQDYPLTVDFATSRWLDRNSSAIFFPFASSTAHQSSDPMIHVDTR
jgi:hypothetical protein